MAAAEGGAPGGRRGRFVREYLRDLDPEAAARRAGYAPARAAATARRLLRDPALGAALRAAWGARAGVSAEAVVRELALIAFADLVEFVDWDADGVRVRDSRALDAARRRAIVEVRQGPQGVQLKLASKQAALDALGRHLGLHDTPPPETTLVIANPRAEPDA
ncbi:terminase small subunit [Marichromatium gracile]|uniref:Phage terminase small subunit n=2 Tax=Marichromatium gracile TaxID=1048 RepID=A0A4V2W9Q9_MARGR|nr:terminase small subunit [Marichromatium gracile]TCW36300.1 phage terminase small subunit [Marichromatium gracile]